MLGIQNVALDCADLECLAAFWSAALGYERRASQGVYTVLVDPSGSAPRFLLQRVPEPRTVKNRVHLDLEADDAAAEIERLLALGATRGESYTEQGVSWTVMADPEGNDFCVVARRS